MNPERSGRSSSAPVPLGSPPLSPSRTPGCPPWSSTRPTEVASSWRSRYDGLRLNTWRRFSHLPGRPYPKGTPTFPSRDQVIEHVERHAGEDGMELWLGTRVERVERDDGGWAVHTRRGRAASAAGDRGHGPGPALPSFPSGPGARAFEGELLHSSEYRNPAPFEGTAVLVVGPGSSGMEIAHELTEGGAAKVWLAVRTPPNILLRQGPGPVPGDLIATVALASADGRQPTGSRASPRGWTSGT